MKVEWIVWPGAHWEADSQRRRVGVVNLGDDMAHLVQEVDNAM